MKKRLSCILIFAAAFLLLIQAGCGAPGRSASVPAVAEPDPSLESTGKYTAKDRYGNQYVQIPEDTFLIIQNGDLQQTRSDMAAALAARETSICIKNQALWYDTPDFYAMPYSTFWLKDMSGEGFYGQTRDDDQKCFYHFYEITYYDYTDEELEQMKAQIDSATEDIVSLVPEDADPWTKARIVHDELCRLISYDKSFEAPHCHDTYGALINHLAVCSGYACAFSHVMTRLDSYSPLSYSDDHAWNHVAVSSDQEYIDVTWDDSDVTDVYGDPYIFYDYFFLTREEVESIDSHSIESMDPFVTTPDPLPFNYHEHEGYLVYSYDWDTIVNMYYQQYINGTNYITVRFKNEEDYFRACQWKENDYEEIYALFTALDYNGAFYYWYNDDRRTVSFGLYAPEEA